MKAEIESILAVELSPARAKELAAKIVKAVDDKLFSGTVGGFVKFAHEHKDASALLAIYLEADGGNVPNEFPLRSSFEYVYKKDADEFAKLYAEAERLSKDFMPGRSTPFQNAQWVSHVFDSIRASVSFGTAINNKSVKTAMLAAAARALVVAKAWK